MRPSLLLLAALLVTARAADAELPDVELSSETLDDGPQQEHSNRKAVDWDALNAAVGRTVEKYRAHDRRLSSALLEPRLAPENAVSSPVKRHLNVAHSLMKRRTGRVWSQLDLEGGTDLWAGNLSVGTPAKQFRSNFDTGSSDILLPSSSCSSCIRSDPYTDGSMRTFYSPSGSSSANTTGTAFIATYLGFSSSGTIVKDTVSVAGLKGKNVALNVATSMDSSLAELDADALVGLAYAGLSATGQPGLLDTLKSQGVIRQRVVGFALRDEDPSTLTVGAWEPAAVKGGKEGVTWYTTAKDDDQYTYHQVYPVLPRVGGKTVRLPKAKAVFDTGTNVVLAPYSTVAKFYEAVKGAHALKGEQEGYYTFPCSSIPSVSFSFGAGDQASVKHSIAKDDFNLGPTKERSKRCIGAVVGADTGKEGAWILGQAFLAERYSVFDLEAKRVGLGRLRKA